VKSGVFILVEVKELRAERLDRSRNDPVELIEVDKDWTALLRPDRADLRIRLSS